MTRDDAERAREAIGLASFARDKAEAARANSDLREAERWFDRCHRLVPNDYYAVLQLALVTLGRDAERSATLFSKVVEAFDLCDAWLGLAAARLSLGDASAAAAALCPALARHAIGPQVHSVADPIARAAGAAGWCGLARDGALTIKTFAQVPIEVRLDGSLLHGPRLPATWPSARTLVVTAAGHHLLGSPINVAAIRRIEGFVEAWAGGLRGWAWHPGDHATDPVLTIGCATAIRALCVTATDLTQPIAESGPQPMQRRFSISAEALRGLSGLLHVRGRDGQDLLGSPLDPGIEQRAAHAAAIAVAHLYPAVPMHRQPLPSIMPPAIPADIPGPRPPPAAGRRRRTVDVVIPVHGNPIMTLACLESVLPTVAAPSRVVVVDDASEEPGLTLALDALAAAKRVRLIRHARNLGFAASANAGISACPGRDVVLLNSDTLVPPDWLERLRDAAYSARDIGSVTPLSNNATIMTWPGAAAGDRMPDQTETTRLDRLARRVNGPATIDIPVGVGFCLYLRRDCIDAVGLLRADLFAQGYGEETDFCLRARHLGWRHVGLTGLFVAHGSGKSFGAAGRHLRARNESLLHRLHPGYANLIERFICLDPLGKARRRLDVARWRADRHRHAEAVILITHDSGGGVEQRILASIESHQAAGRRAIVLRPARLANRLPAIAVCDGADGHYPDLCFALPDEGADVLRLLRGDRPVHVEIHHLLDHHPSVYQMLEQLGLPYDVHVHDYPWFCQRISLVGVHDRYCGEPEPAGCEACIADAGRIMEEPISVTTLLDRSARFLPAARRIVAPSDDTAERMRRHFPALRPIVIPHENDDDIDAPAEPQARDGRCRVCVVGALGVHKGYDVLLSCARDAAQRDLPLDFIVVGTTIDDARLMATGRVFVTGYYRTGEAVGLIRSQNASLALLPSIWPETWCLALTEIWRAGLPVVAFDLGAPAERIRRSGRGQLLPPNLPPRSINNVLIAAVGLARHEGILPHKRK